MTYWLTTHWPRRQGEDDAIPPYGVWVPHDKEIVVVEMKADDFVFIYESLSGRTRITRYADGTTREVACSNGGRA